MPSLTYSSLGFDLECPAESEAATNAECLMAVREGSAVEGVERPVGCAAAAALRERHAAAIPGPSVGSAGWKKLGQKWPTPLSDR